jgi:cation transport protein ChaC
MEQFWVLGYGSLMWRPGFDFVAAEPALIRGYHRSLCVYSHVHRGTPDRPGLVLGLDRGGSCHGMAFRIASEAWSNVLSYLRQREQVTMVYRETRKTVQLIRSGEKVMATTFVVDRGHGQYAGRLSEAATLALVRAGEGQSGRCADYVTRTVEHLREMQIHDACLERLVRSLTEPDQP